MIDLLLRILSEPDPTVPSLPYGATLRRARWLPLLGGRLAGMRGPAAAVTLGRTIVLHPAVRATPALLRHELEHVRQWRAAPLAFPARYVWAHIRHGYSANPYEVEARQAESRGSTASRTPAQVQDPGEPRPGGGAMIPLERGGPAIRSHARQGGAQMDENDGKATVTHDWRRAMLRSVITIDRHILEEERLHPAATGAFSSILYDIALAAKLISREVRQAGLVDILGATDDVNVHGEEVRKLDQYAHEVLYKALDHGGYLCCMASEESEQIIPIPDRFPKGNYVVLFDPLDGSSNIDSNISVGTIFSIHRKRSPGVHGTVEDCLQKGRRQVAAGYVIYGSSTMLVYTTGSGVHGFTLDPSIGEFLLSHPDIRIPDPGEKIYSCNEGNYTRWSTGQRALTDYLKGTGKGATPFKGRYVGSLVADFHRTLLHGGIFMYPADGKNPAGKLRLLYEAAPMALIMEQAGGAATDGERDILDIEPAALHERTPLYLGSREYIELSRSFLATDRNGSDGDRSEPGDEPALTASG